MGRERLGHDSRQSRVYRDRLAHERQGIGASADDPERLGEVGRLDINDAVAEAIRRAGAPVVHLVRIEHDDPPGCTDPRRAPVIEDLDPAVGDADRVRIVAMLLVDLAGQPGAEELDAFYRRRAGQPARDRARARSFKTFAARPGVLGVHTPGGRVRLPSALLRFFSSPSWPRSLRAPATSC